MLQVMLVSYFKYCTYHDHVLWCHECNRAEGRPVETGSVASVSMYLVLIPEGAMRTPCTTTTQKIQAARKSHRIPIAHPP